MNKVNFKEEKLSYKFALSGVTAKVDLRGQKYTDSSANAAATYEDHYLGQNSYHFFWYS